MKCYSVFIDYRDSRGFGDKKYPNIKVLYDKFRNYKVKTPSHSLKYLSFVGDAVLLVVKSNEIQGNFLNLLKEINILVVNIMNETKEKLGIGISYGEIEEITDHKGSYIVSEATDFAASASSLGNKHFNYTWVLPLKTKKIESICQNNDLYNKIDDEESISDKNSHRSKKYFYFNL